jgi:hypothetical protein
LKGEEMMKERSPIKTGRQRQLFDILSTNDSNMEALRVKKRKDRTYGLKEYVDDIFKEKYRTVLRIDSYIDEELKRRLGHG